jgi:arylsulfatase A-like enzyme
MSVPPARRLATRALVGLAWAVAGLVGLALAGCGPSVEAPPIVLVSIDTLRADRLPAYGYRGVETPALDALREHSILFENAYSHMPLTLPAHASILTGLLPPRHGVRINMGYPFDPRRSPSVAATLRDGGYATGAAVASYVLRAETGLDAGFTFYDDDIDYEADAGAGGLQRSGMATLEAVLPWLREHAGAPFFLFLHLYEPHRPYSPPEPFSSRYGDPYDGEVAAADAVVGRLVAELRSLGVYERALVIVTADHGEGLGDHGEDEHGVFIYREVTRVPLLLKEPFSTESSTVAEPVQHVDLAPTVLAAAGVEATHDLDGRSLLDVAAPEPRRIYVESYYPRLEFGWSELRGLVDERYAYVHSPEPELFDLAADPGQLTNLFVELPDVARRYAQELRAIAPDFEMPAAVDTETRRQLEALGYVGGSRSGDEEILPAPRSQTHLLALVKEGMQAYAGGRLTEAVGAFERVLAANPNMVLAWEQRARAWEALRRYDLALADMMEAAQRSVGSPHLYLAAGRLAGLAGRYAEVDRIVAPALAWDPERAYGWMVNAALAQRDGARALAHARSALAAERSVTNLVQEARVLAVLGRAEESLTTLDEAEATGGGTFVDLRLVKATALQRLGRLPEAMVALEEQRSRFPRDSRAYLRSARLLAASGQAEESRRLLFALVDESPTPRSYEQAIRELRRQGNETAAGELVERARSLWEDPALLRGILGESPGSG